MKTSISLKLIVTVLSIFVCLFIMGSESVFSQEDITVVEDSGFLNKTRPGVPFSHDDHNEQANIDDCLTCHHVYEDREISDESSEDMECSECHLTTASHDPMSLIKAYHIRCKGCHLKLKRGPFQCGECHVRD